MNVTITGASGRLGTFVTRALVDNGFVVRATDRNDVDDFPVQMEIANLLDRDACYGLLEGADAVVHLANHPGPLQTLSPQQIFSENTTMNMNVFQAARETGVKKIVFSSSVQVFSGLSWENKAATCLPPYLPLDADVPPNPGNAYALSKQVSEVMLAHFACHGKIDCTALRFPVLVNPAWIERFKDRKSRLGESFVFPDSGAGFSFLHMTDAAALIPACLNASLPGLRIYFPAAGGNLPGKPATEVIREYYTDVPLRCPLEKIERLVDISRVQAETGWTPKRNQLL